MERSRTTTLETLFWMAVVFIASQSWAAAQNGVVPESFTWPVTVAEVRTNPPGSESAVATDLPTVTEAFEFENSRKPLPPIRPVFEERLHVLPSLVSDPLAAEQAGRTPANRTQERAELRRLTATSQEAWSQQEASLVQDAGPEPLVAPETTEPPATNQSGFPQVGERVDFSEFAAAANESLVPTTADTAMLSAPWWSSEIQRTPADERGWELDELIWLAIENSPRVQSFLIEPRIQQARAIRETGVFDANTFVESIFNDTSDPVGNTLVTGSAPRLNDHLWENNSGFRKRNTRGGQAELSQSFDFKDSNSDFFLPANQADSRMVMRYTQPLMRGAGEAYNRSSIVVADLAAGQSFQQAAQDIQEHAFTITQAYWELYAARAFEQQIQRGLESLRALRNRLAGRSDIDSLLSQLKRADAAIARQEASLARSFAQIVRSQASLRAAVAAPELLRSADQNLIPITQTTDWPSLISRQRELNSALENHPNVQALRLTLKADRVRLQVAEHELRPTLDLVLEGYVRGLNGDFNATKSFGDQFSEGAPSYSAGLSYARPYRNTTARAILRERRLELQRTLLQLDDTLLTIGADVEGAIADVTAAFAQLESAVRSTLATHTELEYLTARFNNAFIDASEKSILLDRVLSAEIQLIQAENTWARAQADHMIAMARLRLTTGSLVPMSTLPN